MFDKAFSIAGLAAALLVPGPAQAALFAGRYTVNANGDADRGLAVVTLNDFGSPVSGATNSFADLAIGGPNAPAATYVDLFELFALDDPIGARDAVPLPISVRFDFSAPSASSGTLGGTTTGLVNVQEGLVHWVAPAVLAFDDGSRLQIGLLDTSFGSNFNGVVTAEFTAPAPEPGTWALLLAGLVGAFALRRQRPSAPVAALVAVIGFAHAADARAQGVCIDPTVPASPEEQRLTAKLTAGNAKAFSVDLLSATGFDRFGPDLVAALCGPNAPSSYEQALALVRAEGGALWRAAVDRVQGRKVAGTLPRGDDRMLYWARLAMSKALRQWQPAFALSAANRDELQYQLQRASRGQYDIAFPAGPAYTRIILSGTDPAGLPAPGANGSSLRNGNGSAAIALSLDGTRTRLPDGTTAVIEAYLLPMNYGPFQNGMQEDTLGPWFQSGLQRVDASITMGQGQGDQFRLEQWNGRFHGAAAGNDTVSLCPSANNARIPSNNQCDIDPPTRWLGFDPTPWQPNDPPQFTATTLPIAQILDANTGSGVPRPPGDTAAPPAAFDVFWHPNYTAFGDCTATGVTVFNSSVPGFTPSSAYPRPVTPPSATWCARQGGAGDDPASESAYRNTLLRDTQRLTIAAGHIGTPAMSRFSTDATVVSDPVFEAYRDAVVQQGRNIVFASARNLHAAPTPLVTQAAPVDLDLWPNQVGPGSEALGNLKLTLTERSTDASINDRSATMIQKPYMTMYAPPHPNGVALIVAPGGGYDHETIDKEGTDVAWAFNPSGVTVFVLTYRLPDEGHLSRENVPLEDAQRAIRYLRAHADELNLNPAKIGVMGFSAGGHVAGSLATLYDKPVYAPVDGADAFSARPDFAVLLYPVITMDLTYSNAGSRIALLGADATPAQLTQWSVENWVTASTPPTFVAMAANDTTVNPAHNGILFSQELAALGVPTELHVFPAGGHGFGIRGAVGDGLLWPKDALAWMKGLGILP